MEVVPKGVEVKFPVGCYNDGCYDEVGRERREKVRMKEVMMNRGHPDLTP